MVAIQTPELTPKYNNTCEVGQVAIGMHWPSVVANAIAETVLRYFENIELAQEEAIKKACPYANPLDSEELGELLITCHHVPRNVLDSDVIKEVVGATLKDRDIPWRLATIKIEKYRWKQERSVYVGVELSLRPVDLTDMMGASALVPMKLHHSATSWSIGDAVFLNPVAHKYGNLPNYAVMATSDLPYYFKALSKPKLTKGDKSRQRRFAQKHSRKGKRG